MLTGCSDWAPGRANRGVARGTGISAEGMPSACCRGSAETWNVAESSACARRGQTVFLGPVWAALTAEARTKSPIIAHAGRSHRLSAVGDFPFGRRRTNPCRTWIPHLPVLERATSEDQRGSGPMFRRANGGPVSPATLPGRAFSVVAGEPCMGGSVAVSLCLFSMRGFGSTAAVSDTDPYVTVRWCTDTTCDRTDMLRDACA